jgi:hypothetical protein
MLALCQQSGQVASEMNPTVNITLSRKRMIDKEIGATIQSGTPVA